MMNLSKAKVIDKRSASSAMRTPALKPKKTQVPGAPKRTTNPVSFTNNVRCLDFDNDERLSAKHLEKAREIAELSAL